MTRPDLPDAVPALRPGDPTHLGGYELTGRLGSGGQGTVYLGRGAERPVVAIKLLHAQLLANENARARFMRELDVLRRVAGAFTAQVLEADAAGDKPYIVIEYVPGPSLYEMVRGHGPRIGADLDRLAISTATALTAIHGVGIVHRDFKPQNVLMGPDGPRVIDFGIARALDAGATVTSQVIGTPAYMAPEQFAGARIGPPADLFSWAVTLVFAATGRDPFSGGPLPAVMYRVLHDDPHLGALPPQLATIVAGCLAKDPAARPTAEDALLHLLGRPRTGPRAGHRTGPRTGTSPAAAGPPPPREETISYGPQGSAPRPGPAAPPAETGTLPYDGPPPGSSAGAPPPRSSTGAPPPRQPTLPYDGPPPGSSAGAPPPGSSSAAAPPRQPTLPYDGPPPGSSSAAPPRQPTLPYTGQVPPNPPPGAGTRTPGGANGGQAPWGRSHGGQSPPGEVHGGAAPQGPAHREDAPRGGAYGGTAPGGGAWGDADPQGGVHGGGAVAGGAWGTDGVAGVSRVYGGPAVSGRGPLRGPLRRSGALVGGLVLAVLAAGLDIVSLAILAGDETIAGTDQDSFVLIAGVLAVLALATLVAAAGAWLRSRAAVMIIIVARVIRIAVWLGWSMAADVETPGLVFNVGLTLAVVGVLGYAVTRSAPPTR